MKEIIQIPVQVIEPINERHKMAFKVREFVGRYDVFYVDEEQEVFIVGCKHKSNAELVARILCYDRDNAIVDRFERKDRNENLLQGHKEIGTWEQVAEH